MDCTIGEVYGCDEDADVLGFIVIGSNGIPWAIPMLPTLGHARAVADFARNPSHDLLTCVDIAYTLPVCAEDCGGLIFGDKCNVCGATNPDTGCDDDHSQIGRSLRGATHADIEQAFADLAETKKAP